MKIAQILLGFFLLSSFSFAYASQFFEIKRTSNYGIVLSLAPQDKLIEPFKRTENSYLKLQQSFFEQPLKLLINNRNFERNIMQARDIFEFTLDLHNHIVQNILPRLDANIPLFLSECHTTPCSSTYCTFTRQENLTNCPRYRLLNQILAQESEPNLNIASYGSGNAFFELELAFHLMKQGKKINKLILIDPIYAEIISILNICAVLYRSFRLEDLNDHYLKIFNNYKKIIQFTELLQILGHRNPNIQVFVYKSAEDYKKDCEKNSRDIKANIIIAADFIDNPLDKNQILLRNAEIQSLKTKCLKEASSAFVAKGYQYCEDFLGWQIEILRN